MPVQTENHPTKMNTPPDASKVKPGQMVAEKNGHALTNGSDPSTKRKTRKDYEGKTKSILLHCVVLIFSFISSTSSRSGGIM